MGFFFHKQPQNWNQELWGPQPRIYVAVCFRGYGWQLVNKPHEKTVTTNNLLFSISVCVRVQSLIYCAVISMCHTAALCNRLLYVHECGHWSLFWVHHTLPTLSARHEFSPQLYKMCINPQMEIVQSKPCGPSLHTLRKISSVLDFSRDLFTVAKLETRLHTCKDLWLYAAQMWRFSSDKVCSVLYIQLSEFSQGHSILNIDQSVIVTHVGEAGRMCTSAVQQTQTQVFRHKCDTVVSLSQFNQVCW